MPSRRMCTNTPPEKPADKWQKFYYRGLMPDGQCPVADHQSKLRVKEFANQRIVTPPRALIAARPSAPSLLAPVSMTPASCAP